MKVLRVVLSVLAVLTIIYLFGPKPEAPVYQKDLPELPEKPEALEEYYLKKESQHPVKPDNEAEIIWADDSLKNITEYAVVYLHGFSASKMEGDPVHRDFAEFFGCNLFLSRLAEHGLDTPDAMIHLTAEKYWESAKEALQTGRRIGKKVILMGTSTGGTNALQLAAAYPKDIAAIILLSPNIAINDPNAWILNNHWGLQLAKMVKGGNYNISTDTPENYKKYWYSKYRLEATVALEEMIETTMTKETFSKITQPLLMLYYYKDEAHQDDVVKVSAMKEMFEQISTPPALKRAVAIPGAGNHVIGSPIRSKDVESVKRESIRFGKEVLKIPAAIR